MKILSLLKAWHCKVSKVIAINSYQWDRRIINVDIDGASAHGNRFTRSLSTLENVVFRKFRDGKLKLESNRIAIGRAMQESADELYWPIDGK